MRAVLLSMLLLIVGVLPVALADTIVATPGVPTGASVGPGGPCLQFTHAQARAGGHVVPYGEAGVYREDTCFDTRCDSNGIPVAIYAGETGTWAAVGVADTDRDGNGDTPYTRLFSTDSTGSSPCDAPPDS